MAWPASYTSLLDGGLSVTITRPNPGSSPVERRDKCFNIQYESTNQGDGAATFVMPIDNPYNPQANYPELLHGAKVEIKHTVDSVTTRLYTGYVLNDPRRAPATYGAGKYVPVVCGGPLEVAKYRTDMGYIGTDADTSQWFPNKRNGKWVGTQNDGEVTVMVDDDTKVPYHRAGVISYVPYMGAEYLLKGNGGPFYGARKLTGFATWSLKNNMKARLAWSDDYMVTLDPNDSRWHTIDTWGPDTNRDKPLPLNYSFGGTNGAGHVALFIFTNDDGGVKTTAERFFSIDECKVYCERSTDTYVSDDMTAIATSLGFHTSTNTATVGSLLPSTLVRPMNDPINMLSQLASQADTLVEWGWWGGEWRCRPLQKNWTAILTDPAYTCVQLDSSDARMPVEVGPHPENGIPRVLRLIYGAVSKNTRYVAGMPRTVLAPENPGWGAGQKFSGITAPVMTVDFSDHNMTETHAKNVAARLAEHLGGVWDNQSGSAGIKGGLVARTNSLGNIPAPYIKGGDYAIDIHGSGPLYITRASVDVNTGYVDLELGFDTTGIIEQLASAGRLTRVPNWAKSRRSYIKAWKKAEARRRRRRRRNKDKD